MLGTRREVLSAIGVGVTTSLFGTAAADTGDTTRVFVHPADGLAQTAVDALRLHGGETLLEYSNFEFVVGTVPPDALDALEQTPGIDFVEEDEAVHAVGPAGIDFPDSDDGGLGGGIIGGGDNDDESDSGGGDEEPSSCPQSPVQNPSWGWERIGADAVDETGDGVSIAILDTGIEANHCNLAVEGGRNFTTDGRRSEYADRHGHGTHCAGIASARANESGAVGVAPGADVYAVKVLGDDGSGRQSWMAAGIDWCISNEIEVISMSLGSPRQTRTLDRVIDEAYASGHLLVGAAGNDGNQGDGTCSAANVRYPAANENVIAVSAMDRDDTLASYSSVGPEIELLGPGTRIYSTALDNGHTHKSGTSMAGPFVAGTAALVWAAQDESGPGANKTVRNILANTAEPVLETCAEGYGLVDAAAALNADADAGDGRDANETESPNSDEPDSSAGSGGMSGGAGQLARQVSAAVEAIFEAILAAIKAFLELL